MHAGRAQHCLVTTLAKLLIYITSLCTCQQVVFCYQWKCEENDRLETCGLPSIVPGNESISLSHAVQEELRTIVPRTGTHKTPLPPPNPNPNLGFIVSLSGHCSRHFLYSRTSQRERDAAGLDLAIYFSLITRESTVYMKLYRAASRCFPYSAGCYSFVKLPNPKIADSRASYLQK